MSTGFNETTTKAFFTGNGQLNLPDRTYEALKNEGIEDVDDLEDFDEDSFNAILKKLREPPKKKGDDGKLQDQEPYKCLPSPR